MVSNYPLNCGRRPGAKFSRELAQWSRNTRNCALLTATSVVRGHCSDAIRTDNRPYRELLVFFLVCNDNSCHLTHKSSMKAWSAVWSKVVVVVGCRSSLRLRTILGAVITCRLRFAVLSSFALCFPSWIEVSLIFFLEAKHVPQSIIDSWIQHTMMICNDMFHSTIDNIWRYLLSFKKNDQWNFNWTFCEKSNLKLLEIDLCYKKIIRLQLIFFWKIIKKILIF